MLDKTQRRQLLGKLKTPELVTFISVMREMKSELDDVINRSAIISIAVARVIIKRRQFN